MKGKSINDICIGDTASFQKTLTETDVYLFSGISGDANPAHLNQVEAEKTIFKGRIVHGMLTASLISAVLGMQLPGPGTIYLSQDLLKVLCEMSSAKYGESEKSHNSAGLRLAATTKAVIAPYEKPARIVFSGSYF